MSKTKFVIKEFNDRYCNIRNGRIFMELEPKDIDRFDYCCDGEHGDGDYYESRAASVKLNPSETTPSQLIKALKADKKEMHGDTWFNFEAETPVVYENEIRVGSLTEDQTHSINMILVAYDGSEIVGYVNLKTILSMDEENGTGNFYLYFEPLLVYVLSNHRGNGYGYDLAVGCGHVVTSILEALYKSIQSNADIHPMLNRDIRTDGGDKFARRVAYMLQNRIDDLREFEQVEFIKLGNLEIDGGW